MENTSCDGFVCEHGLCLYIEHCGKAYLLDTGASGLYCENAKRMGIDLSQVEVAFLSHAHYDHSGGYGAFFEQNDRAKVYLQRACKTQEYYKITDSRKTYIGIPREVFAQYSDRFEYVEGERELPDQVFVCPHTTKELHLRGKRAKMFGLREGQVHADDFSHEQTIVFEENGKLYLFNSCSHGGVENIIEEIKARFPGKEIRAFFGGFHMMGSRGTDTCNFTEEEVKQVGETLLKTSGAIFYTGHCTGKIAGAWLKEVMKDRLVPFYSGMEIEL